MERYIREQNPAHYRKILSETDDPKTRQTVLEPLAAEWATVRPPTDKKSQP
jgi:hypothetical protein